jgi:hypothetical protein
MGNLQKALTLLMEAGHYVLPLEPEKSTGQKFRPDSYLIARRT